MVYFNFSFMLALVGDSLVGGTETFVAVWSQAVKMISPAVPLTICVPKIIYK